MTSQSRASSRSCFVVDPSGLYTVSSLWGPHAQYGYGVSCNGIEYCSGLAFQFVQTIEILLRELGGYVCDVNSHMETMWQSIWTTKILDGASSIGTTFVAARCGAPLKDSRPAEIGLPQ